jgi:ribonuclease HI
MPLDGAVGPLLLYFDASLLYGPDNSTPTSAAIGYVVDDGTTTLLEGSQHVDAFVSSAGLELRALVEAARAVAESTDIVSSVHVHGDADAVIRLADPSRPATPSTRLARRRVETIRSCFRDVPVVTYRCVPRHSNERAHALARAGHDPDGR